VSASPHEELARELEGAGLGGARVLLVLGSGLGSFGERVEGARVVPFEDLPSVPSSSVPGHAGRFLRGTVGGCEVLCQQGRVHLYEGHEPEVVTRVVRAAALTGTEAVLLTNAAGGLERAWKLPALMRVEDHLDLTGREPVCAPQAPIYDQELAQQLTEAASAAEVQLWSGRYAGLVGPGYETAAEIRWLARLGASAVGMSTVHEAVAARGAGLRVAAVSCITNPAAGIAAGPLHHEEVVAAGLRASADFGALVEAFVSRLA
jgi:purine-nucleoside phosphorylase